MLRVLDKKLLEEIEVLIKQWLFVKGTPRDLVYTIEELVTKKITEQAMLNIK